MVDQAALKWLLPQCEVYSKFMTKHCVYNAKYHTLKKTKKKSLSFNWNCLHFRPIQEPLALGRYQVCDPGTFDCAVSGDEAVLMDYSESNNL